MLYWHIYSKFKFSILSLIFLSRGSGCLLNSFRYPFYPNHIEFCFFFWNSENPNFTIVFTEYEWGLQTFFTPNRISWIVFHFIFKRSMKMLPINEKWWYFKVFSYLYSTPSCVYYWFPFMLILKKKTPSLVNKSAGKKMIAEALELWSFRLYQSWVIV